MNTTALDQALQTLERATSTPELVKATQALCALNVIGVVVAFRYLSECNQLEAGFHRSRADRGHGGDPAGGAKVEQRAAAHQGFWMV